MSPKSLAGTLTLALATAAAAIPGARAEEMPAATAAGIQWFSTWIGGTAEAKRTGRPILLVSAAPHCHGISGLW